MADLTSSLVGADGRVVDSPRVTRGSLRRGDRWQIMSYVVLILVNLLTVGVVAAGSLGMAPAPQKRQPVVATAGQVSSADLRLAAVELRMATMEAQTLDRRLVAIETLVDEFKEQRKILYGIVGTMIGTLILGAIQVKQQTRRRVRGRD